MSDRNVLSINKNKPKDIHKEGAAICLNCKYTWTYKSPLQKENTPIPENFKCPKCDLYKSVFRGLSVLAPYTICFSCNCGNDRFVPIKTGMFCECCGVVHDWSVINFG